MQSITTTTTRMVNSPVRWIGGKSRLRRTIVQLMPPHTVFVELFGGAAWVTFAKPRSSIEIINDIDDELMNFFRVLRDQREAFVRSFDYTLVGRAEFDRLKALDPRQLSEVQRAHRFYYLLHASWGGEILFPRFQTYFNDRGHGNRLIGALRHLEQRINPAYERLQTVILESLDWQACLERYDRPGTLFYVDPPYLNNGCNYAHQMKTPAQHAELACRLKQAKSQWILSAADEPSVHATYRDYSIVPVAFASGLKQRWRGVDRIINREVLVMNFEPPAAAMERLSASELPSEQAVLESPADRHACSMEN